jgi:hypothetical protein
MFLNPKEAALMTWWDDERKVDDDKITHPTDCSQWKDFNDNHKDSSQDPRNAQFALSTDIKVVLFRCRWIKQYQFNEIGLRVVDLQNVDYHDDPWVLASRVAQVCYMPDPHSILPQRRELSTGCPRKTAHYRS